MVNTPVGVRCPGLPVEQGEVEIGKRDGLFVAQVAVPANPGGGTARKEDGQVRVVVHVRIADAAAEKDQRMIEERPVPLGDGGEVLEILGEERDVKGVDL